MRAPIFRGKVLKGKIKLDNRERFELLVKSFEGKRIELILRERQAGRSDEANKYYWAIPVAILSEHLGYEPEELHEILKNQFKVVSTARMETAQFWEYIEKIRRWAIQFHGVNIPDPGSVDY